jgi:hypothetical protein
MCVTKVGKSGGLVLVAQKRKPVKNTSVLGGRSIRQVQYSSSKSHPTKQVGGFPTIVVLALDFGSFIKKRTKKSKISPALKKQKKFIAFF